LRCALLAIGSAAWIAVDEELLLLVHPYAFEGSGEPCLETQPLQHCGRVEIESPTNGLEGVKPICFSSEEPLSRLMEDLQTLRVCREAVFFDAVERVAEDGDHQSLLGSLFAGQRKVLRRQEGAEL